VCSGFVFVVALSPIDPPMLYKVAGHKLLAREGRRVMRETDLQAWQNNCSLHCPRANQVPTEGIGTLLHLTADRSQLPQRGAFWSRWAERFMLSQGTETVQKSALSKQPRIIETTHS